MAKPSENPSIGSWGASPKNGSGQAVVELCEANPRGIVFWSSRRYEIGAQLQVRLRLESLPEELRRCCAGHQGWVNLVGYVAVCVAERRSNATHGFQTTLLLPGDGEPMGTWPPPQPQGLFQRVTWLGGKKQGLN